MELNDLCENIDSQLIKLDAQVSRLSELRAHCDDAQEQAQLSNDLLALYRIREKLLKSKDLAQEVHQLNHHPEDAKPVPYLALILLFLAAAAIITFISLLD